MSVNVDSPTEPIALATRLPEPSRANRGRRRRIPRWLRVLPLILTTVSPLRAAGLAYHPAGEPGWSSPGSDSRPTWLADGSEILFQRTRDEGVAQIWAVAPDGTGLRRITDGRFAAGHPDACADGDLVALVSDRDGAREVYTMGVDGGDLRRLTDSGVDKAWPVFSPDCREIAFVEMRDRDRGRYDLKTVDVASGDTRVLMEQVRYLGWPTWSEDNEHVLFHRELEGHPNHLWRVRRDGGGAEALSRGDGGDYWSARVSRDGGVFSFAYGRRSQLEWGGNADLWIMERDGKGCRQVLGNPWHEHGQSLSPDGRRLVYWDHRDGYSEVWLLDLEGGASRQLTFQPPTELTGIVRRQGVNAAVEHARRQRAGLALYSEQAMATLLANRARRAEPPATKLAALFHEDHPQSRRARAALAREHLRNGELEAARSGYRELLEGAPADPDTVARLGTLAVLEVATGRSLAELDQEGAPQTAVNALGYALMRAEHLDAAIDLLGWNARAFPDSWNAHDSLGEALYWRGESAAAKAAFTESLRLNPGNENARRFLRRIETATEPTPTIPCPAWPLGTDAK